MKMLVVQRTYLGKEETQAILLLISVLTNPRGEEASLIDSFYISLTLCGHQRSHQQHHAFSYKVSIRLYSSSLRSDDVGQSHRCWLYTWKFEVFSTLLKYVLAEQRTHWMQLGHRKRISTLDSFQNLSEFRRNLHMAPMKYVFYKTFTGLPPTGWQLYYFRRTQLWFLCESDSAHGVPRLFKPCLAESMEIHCCKSKQFGLRELGNMLTYLAFQCN